MILGPPGWKALEEKNKRRKESRANRSRPSLTRKALKNTSEPETLERRTVRSRKKVFVVHGHDHALKSDVEVFLGEVGLEPVVLHREADQGQTVIEKFEHHSDVDYVIVLLTPDDVGCSAIEFAKADKQFESRARQNVVFELGFFAGRLGRPRVCCIYKAGVALPSDLSGFVYKEIRSSIEEVGYSLIKEFKAAGLEIQMRS
jgi:predicted nucleotide-binding protein